MFSSVEIPVVAFYEAGNFTSAERTLTRIAAVVAYYPVTLWAYIPPHIAAIRTAGILCGHINSAVNFVVGVMLALRGGGTEPECPGLHPMART